MVNPADLVVGRRARASQPPRRLARASLYGLWGALLLVLGCSPEPSAPLSFPAAPEFSLQRLDESLESVRLSDLQGKTVVLDFWAIWCVPCIDQVPALNAFYEAHAEDPDVAVFGVSTDLTGVESVREWVKEQGVRYPILVGGMSSSWR